MEQAALNRKTETPQDCAGKLSEKWLTFRLNGQLYGLSIAAAEQIVRMQPITAVPHFPSCARGVINLRGNIVPLVDLRRVLRLPEGVETERTCIIIASIGVCQVGFMVDDVDAVLDIPPEAVSALPGGGTGSRFQRLSDRHWPSPRRGRQRDRGFVSQPGEASGAG